jgi:segregation and condensation protein B
LTRPSGARIRVSVLGEERLHSIIESIVLISPEPVPVARVVEVIRIEDPQTDEAAIRQAIHSLLLAYQETDRPIGRGFRIDEVGSGLQFRTVAENAQYVRRFLAAKPQRLTKASLETLSVIAYRQPVTKPEIEAIRGVDVGAAIKSLLERDLIKIIGKREEIGRPIIYGTTPGFLEFFGLKTLAELPTLREYHELDEEHQKEVDALDAEEKPRIEDLAAVATFLAEREHDPDLDALDKAVQDADRVRRTTERVLNPAAPPADPIIDGAAEGAVEGAPETTSELPRPADEPGAV